MARQIVVDIIGDDRKFKSTMDSASGKVDGFGSKFKGVATKVAAGGAIIVGAAVVAGTAIFEAGSQMEALDNKAKTVFGGSLGTVQKWASANAGAMGLTKREAVGLAAAMGDLLVPMGFTRDAAADMATKTVGLAGALSEWSGGQKSAAEVSDILTKAMLGERDGLKALGISITEADIQQQLLKNGTNELTGAALEQAKAMATQELIFAKSTDAQDAYAAGTAKGIRTQNEMNAMLKEVGDTIISKLYPIVLKIATFMKENLPKAIAFAKDAWKTLGPVILTIAGFLGDVARVVIPRVASAVGSLVSAFQKYWPVVSGAVSTAVGIISGVIGTVVRVIGTISTAVGSAVTSVTTAFNNIVNFIKGVPGKISSALGNLFKPLWDGFRRFINMLIRGWNSLKFTMPSVDLGPLGKVGGFTIGTPNIPYLHAGGIVPGVPGSDVPAILQAGEQVIARKDVGRGDIHIHFNGPVFGDGMDELAQKLATRLRTVG